jgi:hypothetical protein
MPAPCTYERKLVVILRWSEKLSSEAIMSQLKISNGKKFTARTGLGRLRQHLNCAEIFTRSLDDY